MNDPKLTLENANNLVVIGVNADFDSFANKIVRKIRELNKTAFQVNPKYDELFDAVVYKSLDDIDEPIDVAVFVVNPRAGLTYLESVVQKGIKTIWLQPGTISDELLAKASDLGLETIEACVLVVGNYILGKSDH
jgi:predicted CoA-binding protein